MSVVAPALSSTSRRKSHYRGEEIRKREKGVDAFACNQVRLLLVGPRTGSVGSSLSRCLGSQGLRFPSGGGYRVGEALGGGCSPEIPEKRRREMSNCKVPWWTNVSERSLLACCWVVFLGGLSLLLWGDAIEPGWIAEGITLILAFFMLALVFVVGYSVKWERKPRPPRPLPNSSAMSVSNCKVSWWTNVGERSLLRCLGVVFLGYLSLSLWGDAIEPGWIAEVITLILAFFFLALAIVVGCSVKWERKS